MELTTEQEFGLVVFSQKVQAMNESESKAALIELYKLMVQKDTCYKVLIAKQWGLGTE